MIGAVNDLVDRQRPLQQRKSLTSPTQGPQRQPQVIQVGSDLGVIGAVDSLVDRQRPLQQRKSLTSPTQVPQRQPQVIQVGSDLGVIRAVNDLDDRQRPVEQRQCRSRLGVFLQVGRGPVTQPGQAVDRGIIRAGMPQHGDDMWEIDPPHRPGLRVPHDVFGQDAAQQPHQSPGPRRAHRGAHGPAGRRLHQPVHLHHVLITTGQAVPDQRADRRRPARPVTGRVLQRSVVEPDRIREQTEGDLLRVAQRPQLQQLHRSRTVTAQPLERQLPQHRDRHPRPIGHLPLIQHVAELIGEQVGVLRRWGTGLIEITSGLLDRQW